MRHFLRVAAALLALTACGAPAPSAPPAPALQSVGAFPNVRLTPFRATAAMVGPQGAALNVVVLRDGAKTRVEAPSPQGEVVRVTDSATGEVLMWRRQMGRVILIDLAAPLADGETAPVFPDFWWDGDIAAAMRAIGACDHLGESGSEWAREGEDGPQNLCVAADGVVLWAANSGATIWRLTSLQRGPQDSAEFVLPAGARPARPEPVVEERDLDAAYVPPPPQFSTRSDMPAPQNQ